MKAEKSEMTFSKFFMIVAFIVAAIVAATREFHRYEHGTPVDIYISG